MKTDIDAEELAKGSLKGSIISSIIILLLLVSLSYYMKYIGGVLRELVFFFVLVLGVMFIGGVRLIYIYYKDGKKKD